MSQSSVDGHRPGRIVVVAGTATEVGKTWVAAHVARELIAGGTTVAVRKPVQSFDVGDGATDAHVLAEASGEDTTEVCPHHRWYEVAMAPPMAADALGRPPFTIADLALELGWPIVRPQVGLVEAAGGVRSPLARDGDTVTLVEALQPELVALVADAGLGTINGVRLAVEALDRGAHVASLAVFLNRFDGTDDLHRRNLDWLRRRCGLDVVTAVPDLSTRVRGDEARPSRA